MPFDPNEAYRKHAARFSVRHMSNAKWRELLGAWAGSGVRIDHAEWSFIDDGDVLVKPLPLETELLERRFADGRFQPFEYRWILSVRIPNRFRPLPDIPYERPQDTRALLDVASSLGRLPVFETADAIVVRGYDP